MKTLKVNQKIKVDGFDGKAEKNIIEDVFFICFEAWEHTKICNKIFRFINCKKEYINKYDFQKRILGYSNLGGFFPYCLSLEDLTIFVECIEEELKEN